MLDTSKIVSLAGKSATNNFSTVIKLLIKFKKAVDEIFAKHFK